MITVLKWLFFDYKSLPLVEKIIVPLMVLVLLLWIGTLFFGAIQLLTLPLYL